MHCIYMVYIKVNVNEYKGYILILITSSGCDLYFTNDFFELELLECGQLK